LNPIRSLFAASILLAAGVAALAYAAEGAPPPSPRAYLGDDAPDTRQIVTPPPPPGSLAESRDRSVFLATRALAGTPRWSLAASDAVQTPAALTDDFTCALGVAVEPTRSPRLSRLLERTMRDAGAVTTKPKDFFGRQRPFVLYGGPICTEDLRENLIKQLSYPSGHTTVSWAYGLILAELFPDKAAPILARARAYGESRVVCGVHTVSDVEAGRVNGSALVAALHANPEFTVDLSAARTEVAALRRTVAPLPAERAGRCALEAEASSNRPW
jgi:acid phosphatase (class A)